MIIDAIKDIKNNAAPGTDNFPAILLKECAEELSEPLYILWRFSLEEVINFPQQGRYLFHKRNDY